MGPLSLNLPPELLDAIAERVAEKLAERLPAPAREELVEQARNGRLTLTKAEAAEALGISVDHFERKVMPELRIVRSGRLRLIPLTELERWVAEHAARPLGDGR